LISFIKRIFSGLGISIVVFTLATITIWQWPFLTARLSQTRELQALMGLVPILPYVFYGAGSMIAFRYNQTGLVLSSFFLAFSYFLVTSRNIIPADMRIHMVQYLAFLLPINFVFFSFLNKRKVLSPKGFLYILLILVEVIFVALVIVISNDKPGWFSSHVMAPIPLKKWMYGISTEFNSVVFIFPVLKNSVLSLPVVMSCLFCFFTFFIRFLNTRSVIVNGFLGILVTAFAGIVLNGRPPAVMIYFAASGLILAITTIEVSFSMAYIDDLTGLPGRRSLNEALINLGGAYVIAMVDVDHFKKFNDTYGHETGDQVLKMIASHFSKLAGGAKSFRYGGEEFTAIFKGKCVEDAMPHLEKFRKAVESFPFAVRGKDRPKQKKKGVEKRKTSALSAKTVRVTVSIGVSEPSKTDNSPDKVIKNADKALYRAKKAGRNRIMG